MSVNHRVLVVDDDRELLETYRETLHPSPKQVSSRLRAFAETEDPIEESAGPDFDVNLATQGEEGVEMVR